MASITLDKLAHSYCRIRKTDADFALKEIDYKWEDGGAYALLGPSGCGKTTLLNIISGLLVPSKGHIKFDGQDVTHSAARGAQHRPGVPVPGHLRHHDGAPEPGLSTDQPSVYRRMRSPSASTT
jgi:ABC-type Fe3+/spermidine/putrescine transport system ATPase subunit